jgi:hypothetical protein
MRLVINRIDTTIAGKNAYCILHLRYVKNVSIKVFLYALGGTVSH